MTTESTSGRPGVVMRGLIASCALLVLCGQTPAQAAPKDWFPQSITVTDDQDPTKTKEIDTSHTWRMSCYGGNTNKLYCARGTYPNCLEWAEIPNGEICSNIQVFSKYNCGMSMMFYHRRAEFADPFQCIHQLHNTHPIFLRKIANDPAIEQPKSDAFGGRDYVFKDTYRFSTAVTDPLLKNPSSNLRQDQAKGKYIETNSQLDAAFESIADRIKMRLLE